MAKQQDISKLGKILGIWAHPDDEAWAAAGLMSAAAANGQKVACVIATKGSAGKTADESRWPASDLSRIRETELGEALAIIGVHDLYWLGYEDGRLSTVDDREALEQLAVIIDKVQPDTIITFEPEGITGHDDHRAVCTWACQAAAHDDSHLPVYGACETTERYEKVGRVCDEAFDIYFNTKHPFTIDPTKADLYFKLTPSQARLKAEALKAHQSQTHQLFSSKIGRQYIKQLCSEECFIKLEPK